MSWLTWIERSLIVTGCACLAAVGVSHARAASFQQAVGQKLEHELTLPAASAPSGSSARSAASVADALIGRLEIPRLKLSVIVMDGDDRATLAHAIGHVRGTALPWEAGNTVMAGHRDTFFAPLEGVRDGDEIRMTTARGTFEYRVVRTEVVAPDDVSVLRPTPERSLTLVTCYPFVYVGRAPERFIVYAR